MTDDAPLRCQHHYCSAPGTQERTEVYVVPESDFTSWYEAAKHFPDEGVTLHMDDYVRPKKVWKSETEVYRYQYNESNKYLPTIIRNDNTKVYTKYNYDNCGNIIEMEIGKLNSNNEITGNPKLISKTTYSPDGSQIKVVTNANGQKTEYKYSNRRNLQQTIDINGTSVVSIENTLNDRPVTSYINGVVSVGYSYNGGLLSRITRGGFITGNSLKQNQFYNMTYDDFGNMTKVSIGGTNDVAADSYVLATYDYGDANGHLNSMTYGNGDSITYYYDELDRMTEEVWDDGTSYEYFYNSEGALSKKVDTTTGDTVNYEYDSIGRLIHSSITSWNAAKQENEMDMLTEHLYDRQNRVKEQSYQIRNSGNIFTTYSQKYTYRGSDGLLTNVESKYSTTDGSTDKTLLTYALEYDELARLKKRTNSYFTQAYGYRASDSNTTTQIESIVYDKGTAGSEFTKFTLSYEYDELGNIETITNSENPSDNRAYTYDIQGQLLSETFGTEGNSTTNSYTYDTYGNIRTATVNGTTHTYTYDDANWKDKLTAYDGCPIPYDEIGNPLGYNNGKEWWSFRWSNGRQLASAMSENRIITYTYDMAGIRDSKTANGITYHYDTLNGKVVRQTWTQNGKEKVFDIIYDAGGQPYACVYEGYRYYYVLNQQGDVIQIVGSEGTVCAEYRYDAWGNVLEIGGMYDETLGAVNPIRYRGYYYDTETGFYYLQSRYYDPSIGRFINADSFTSTGQGFLGCNMFAYCNNNPPRYTDSAGFSVKDCFLENIKDGKIPIGGGGGGGVILKIAGTGLWEAFLSFIFGEDEENIGESAVTGAVSGISDSGLVPKKITVPLLAIYTFYDNLGEGDTPVTGDKFCKALYKTATTVFLGEISLTDDEFNRMSLYIFQAGEDLGIGGIERLAHNFIDNITIEVYKPNYTAPAFGAVGGGARNSYYAFN